MSEVSSPTPSHLAFQAEQLQLLADRLPVFIAYCDTEGRFVYVNSRYAERHGLRREEVIGRHISDIIGVEAYKSLERHVETALSGQPVSFQVEIPYRTIGHRYTEASYVPHLDERGRAVGFYALISDVSERHRAEVALVESEERSRLALDAARAMAYEWNLTTGVFKRSENSVELMGLSGDRAEDFFASVHPEDLPGVLALLDASSAPGSKYRFEFRYLHPGTGETRWLELRGHVGLAATGDVRRTGIVTDVSDRVRIAVELQQVRDRFEIAAHATGAIVYDWDAASGRITRQCGLEAVTGWREEEAPKTAAWWHEQIYPLDLPAVARENVADHGESTRKASYRIRHRDGSWRSLEDTASIFRNETGAVARMVGFMIDVTRTRERERSQSVLLEFSDRTREIDAPDAIMAEAAGILGIYLAAGRVSYSVVDAAGGVIERLAEWNDGSLPGMIGRHSIASLNQGAFDTLRRAHTFATHNLDEDPRMEPALTEATLKSGTRASITVPLVRGGELKALFSVSTATPRRWSEEEVRLTEEFAARTWAAVDRARAERAFKESEERFRMLANNMSQFAWMADSSGSIYWYNQRWYDYTGTTPEAMMGWGWRAVHHPGHLDRVVEHFKRCVESGVAWEDTFPLRGNDGVFRWFLSRALPIRNEDGAVVRWFGTNTDINSQRESEAELRRLNADLEQFAYSASHDLQEPLRSVTVYSELLEKRFADKLDGQALEFLKYITSGASRMEMLIHDLLAYTQVTNLETPIEPLDSSEVLRAALSNLNDSIAAAGARIELDGSMPKLSIHRIHLQQLFQNLIGNAVKYRRRGVPPVIRLTVTRQPGNWLFSVKDNGIGIDADFRERIFGLFKRLHTAEEYPGTGIGLAICQRIVERAHGRIWVESEPGQGSNFLFTLPAV